MVKIMSKIKPRALNFRYVIAIDVTIMYISFQMNQQVLLRVTVKLT